MLKFKERCNKEYYPLISYEESAPNLQMLLEGFNKNQFHKKYLLFMEHITLNPEGSNWKFYHFQLNRFSYKSFLFAFAYEAWHFSSNEIVAKQFQSNAKRLQKELSKLSICLSRTERQLLQYCCTYSMKSEVQRAEQAEACLLILILEYLS